MVKNTKKINAEMPIASLNFFLFEIFFVTDLADTRSIALQNRNDKKPYTLLARFSLRVRHKWLWRWFIKDMVNSWVNDAKLPRWAKYHF